MSSKTLASGVKDPAKKVSKTTGVKKTTGSTYNIAQNPTVPGPSSQVRAGVVRDQPGNSQPQNHTPRAKAAPVRSGPNSVQAPVPTTITGNASRGSRQTQPNESSASNTVESSTLLAIRGTSGKPTVSQQQHKTAVQQPAPGSNAASSAPSQPSRSDPKMSAVPRATQQKPADNIIRFCIISDTHKSLEVHKCGETTWFPHQVDHMNDIDVLLHCGDMATPAENDRYEQKVNLYSKVIEDLKSATPTARLKLVIAGNHDGLLDFKWKRPGGKAQDPDDLKAGQKVREMFNEENANGIYYLDEGAYRFNQMKNGRWEKVTGRPTHVRSESGIIWEYEKWANFPKNKHMERVHAIAWDIPARSGNSKKSFTLFASPYTIDKNHKYEGGFVYTEERNSNDPQFGKGRYYSHALGTNFGSVRIPRGIDILMTHETPGWAHANYHIIPPEVQTYTLDMKEGKDGKSHDGSWNLWQAMREAMPRVACFGHCHYAGGVQMLHYYHNGKPLLHMSPGQVTKRDKCRGLLDAPRSGQGILMVNATSSTQKPRAAPSKDGIRDNINGPTIVEMVPY